MALNSPWMTDELRLLAEQTRRFLEREMVPHHARWEEQGIVDRSAWLKAGEAGLLCASIPEDYGGGGGTLAHEAVILEECARAGVASGFGAGNGVHSSIVAHYILAYGTEEQKRRWLPPMATGERIAAIAMTEPGTGSDLQSVRTSAIRQGNQYTLNGSKTFITNGQNADLILVVAKTDPTQGARGVSLIMLEAWDAPGFRRGRNLDKVGMHAQDTSELFFDDVRVPTANLLGESEGQGFIQLMVQLAWERLTLALGSTVAMETAVEITTAYVRQRHAFGRPVWDFQNTQFRLAEAKTLATVARSFTDALMVKLLDGALTPEEAAMAKWWTTEQAGRVIDECVQLHGGYGYMNEYQIARMWRDQRVARIYGGTNEIMKAIIARAM